MVRGVVTGDNCARGHVINSLRIVIYKQPNARNGISAEVKSLSQSTLSTEINFHAKFDVNICDPKCGYKCFDQFSSITTSLKSLRLRKLLD